MMAKHGQCLKMFYMNNSNCMLSLVKQGSFRHLKQ